MTWSQLSETKSKLSNRTAQKHIIGVWGNSEEEI